MSALHLSEINIYPIKSAKGISLSSAKLDARGLEFDRRWMVVDEQGHFLTQRTIPKMAVIGVSLQSDHLSVRARGTQDLMIPLESLSTKAVHVQIWSDALEALDVGDEAASWFTEVLGLNCRLVQMPREGIRSVNPHYAPPNTPVSFADAYPVLLISTASLADLNARLSEPVPMNRFRPNIVIDGSGAYEEDSWKSVRVGSVLFSVVKPCSRCTVPTVNQDTGESGKEPLRTLSTYRVRDSNIYFGQNLIHENRGILNVGDPVFDTLR
jgi:uncharacterized protein